VTGCILDSSGVGINVAKWGLVLVLMLLLFVGMGRGCDGVGGALASRLWWWGQRGWS
jgi:hypothetical protein